jgi:hypothetical protein
MKNLADSFPESFRKGFSERNLILGSVIKIYDPWAEKYKIHIIVGFDKEKILTATVRINSEKNINVFSSPYLKNLCHTLRKKQNIFLKWDSFVDCSKLLEWETSELLDILIEKPGILQGNIEEKELDIIRSVLATARTIEPKKKKKYGLE